MIKNRKKKKDNAVSRLGSAAASSSLELPSLYNSNVRLSPVVNQLRMWLAHSLPPPVTDPHILTLTLVRNGWRGVGKIKSLDISLLCVCPRRPRSTTLGRLKGFAA